MPHHSFRPPRPERCRGASSRAGGLARRFGHRSPRWGSLRAGGAARLGVGGGMSTEQRQFTPSRENVFPDILAMFNSWDRGRWEASYLRHYHLEAAREHDRDSRTPLVLWWRGEFTPSFERHGRHFVRVLSLDALGELVGSVRGSALAAKPDEELRCEIALFKRVQAAREAAFEYTGRGQYGGKDVPARLGLGGLQVFTAGVKTSTSGRRATPRGGHTKRPR